MKTTSKILWRPPADKAASTTLARYQLWLERERGLKFADYESLWLWSTANLEAFWQSVWDFFGVKGERSDHVLDSRTMPFAKWFPGARLNYAAHLLSLDDDGETIVALAEDGPTRTLSRSALRQQAASVAARLTSMGVVPGDRVAAYLPNIPETVVGFAAAASIGAVWTSCSPEFGAPSVLDRFRQVEPKILITADGYRYRGAAVDRRSVVELLRTGLPSVEHVIHVPYPMDAGVITGAIPWGDVAGSAADWSPVPVAFDHPLWILYSSGTTGLPKPIVHGHGGMLLEHLKSHGLHLNLRKSDTFFWFTSTGWVMWNLLAAGLLMGSRIVLFDGDPAYPTLDVLWAMAERLGINVFGASASLYSSCMKAGMTPGAQHDLSALHCVGSTGSPLTTDAFRWIYREVKDDVWVMSFSGGTDVATAFVGGNPMLPVREGEIQCRWLGVDATAFDDEGRPTQGIGELVIREPMPSMPLYLWNDIDGSRYLHSYFSTYPGTWRHGDWIQFSESGGAIIHGRSDSTINRRGVRMGTSEIYRVVEAMPEIADSLVVDLEGLGGASYLVAFVVVAEDKELNDDLTARLRARIRTDLSPRHVPDEFVQVAQVPRTLNGKKLEVPVKRILLGSEPAEIVSQDAMANPGSLDQFVRLGKEIRDRLGIGLPTEDVSAGRPAC